MHEATRHFGEVKAVQGVSLEVPSGSILGVIGPSGSGKTTTVRMMTGALIPTSGSVRVMGEDPRHFRRSTRERIGYMPQLFVLYPDLTTAENLSFVASLFGMLWPKRQGRVKHMLKLVDLWDARSRRAKDLSGGMERRLALACALVHDPALVFLDEPSAGIDPLLRQHIWEELRRRRDEGRTLVVTTQYVTEAEYCDRVALLSGGRLIALDTPEQLRRRALGGEVTEIETSSPLEASSLARVPGVKTVRQLDPRHLLVVSTDSAVTTPRVLEAVAQQGVQVVTSNEYHPTFDEVFAELVTSDRNGEGFRADGPVDRAA
jgi:ABC-2 type transport system ATP-binding protein